MLGIRSAICGLVIFAGLHITVLGASTNEPVLSKVRELHQQPDYIAAETLLKDAVAAEPRSQKLSLYYGLNLRYQKRYQDAETELMRAISLNSDSWDAQQATFLLAKVQALAGKRTAALATIQKMKSKFPDSGWLPQAWVVEAEINMTNSEDAKTKLDKQNEGEKEYKQLSENAKDLSTEAKIEEFKELAADYKGLPIELSARESVGHLLTTTSNTREAIAVFQQIVIDLREVAPESRIVRTATSRIAALYHRLGDRETALSVYRELLDTAGDDNLSNNAVLQSAGIAFEILQHDAIAGEYIQPDQWEEIRSMIMAARRNDVSTRTQVISLLMELESYQWSGDYDKALASGNFLLDSYSTSSVKYRKEIATAHVVMSRLYKELRDYKLSTDHASVVIAMYPTENSIWTGMDHLQRTYYDLVESLYSEGLDNEAERILKDFYSRFPNSPYLKSITFCVKGGIYKRRSLTPGEVSK